MRLWHIELIPYLPKNQLISQWRELLAIKGSIDKKGTPNHGLVNKVLDYPIEHFKKYTLLICKEMFKRKIKFDIKKLKEIYIWQSDKFKSKYKNNKIIYNHWHNKKYLKQCYYNLQEKHDCGLISRYDWERIDKNIKRRIK